MKKLSLSFLYACLMSIMPAMAQNEVGHFTIYPRIGVNLSNISGNGNPGGVPNHHYQKTNFAAGVEGEYQLTPVLGISAGMFYSMQGAKMESYYQVLTNSGEINLPMEITWADLGFLEEKDQRINMEYLNIPVMANVYVGKGLSLKAGLQAGLLLSAKHQYDGLHSATREHIELYGFDPEDIKRDCNTIDLSIPVGISYSVGALSMDLRYNLGLTHVFKDCSDRNSVLMLTIGARLPL